MTNFTCWAATDPRTENVSYTMPSSPHPRSPRRPPAVGALLIGAATVVIVVTATLALRSLDAASETSALGVDPATSLDTEGTASSTTAPPTTAPTTVAPTTAAPTTVPPTTTTTAPLPPPPPSYRTGDSGPEVAAIQQRLLELNFWVPAADGNYGAVTAQAVMAFQKSAGLSRDGVAGPNTLAALATAAPVWAVEGGDHIEIDLERQLMFVVHGGRTYVFNTSTGRSGWRTPPGRFTITREIDGVRRAELGDLYRPKYFNGGIALHGAPSIPGYPASHGCARLHNAVADLIWDLGLAPIGTPVWVR